MDFTSGQGEQRYEAFVRAAASSVVGLDFDGTLSPIVDDPEQAHIHPDARDVLVALAAEVRAVAVITGRPARQALDLGGLEEVGAAVGEAGSELYLFGQYGNERWSSSRRRIVSPRPPRGLATFERELPRLLRSHDGAFEALLPALRELAGRHDLIVEPGRHVVEIRSSGMHKGVAVRTLADELDAGGFLFAGDDLGDVEAFEALGELQESGLPTLRVCSASREQSALVPMSDVVVKGPDGVLQLLAQLTADARDLRS